jgi:hypothetical protein
MDNSAEYINRRGVLADTFAAIEDRGENQSGESNAF